MNKHIIVVTISLAAILCAVACVAVNQQVPISKSRNMMKNPAYLAKQAKSKELSTAAYHTWKVEKNLPKAELLFRKQLAIEDDNVFAQRGFAELLEEEGKTTEAAEFYRKVVYPPAGSGSTFSEDPSILVAYGSLLDKQGKRTEATRVYKKAVLGVVPIDSDYPTLSADNATPEQLRALAYVAKGMGQYRYRKSKEAEQWYARAVHLQPQLGIAQFYYGKALEDLGKNAEAKQAYQKAIKYTGLDTSVADAAKVALDSVH